MKTTSKIQLCVEQTPKGEPFTSAALLKYGARAAVDQALSRLAASGKIVRITRGVYVRPEENRFVGQVLPAPFKVVEAIAKRTHEVIQVNGAEAARQFGFTTQVPTQPVFLTTGQARKFKIGTLEINLRHVSRKKIPFPESKVGLAILALWHLGKKHVTPLTIQTINKKLTAQEFKKFKFSTEYMPIWMTNAVLQYEKEKQSV